MKMRLLRCASSLVVTAATLLAFTQASCGSSDGGGTGNDGTDASSNPRPDGSTPSGDGGSTTTCTLPPSGPANGFVLRYDQLGYLTKGVNWAMLLSHGKAPPTYQIVDDKGCNVGDPGKAGQRAVDVTSRAGSKITGDRIDLSAIKKPGTYWVVVDGIRLGPIKVADDVYANLLPTMLAFLKEQRCGATTAAVSKHSACHLFSSVTAAGHSGDGVAVADGTTANITLASGPAVDAEGGWHDAGDYIKFVGTTAFVLSVDLLALRDHPAAFASPALGNVGADLKAEMRWGLDWLVKMLGGATLYHQCSGAKDHDPAPRIPEADTAAAIPGYAQRPLFMFADGKGANLLGRGAAALALGSVVFKDDAAYSAKLLAAARNAYAAYPTRKSDQNPDPVDFYQESTYSDDLAFGAAELAMATGEQPFKDDALKYARIVDTTSTPAKPMYWGDVTAMGLLETGRLYPVGDPIRVEMAGLLTEIAVPMLQSATMPSGPGAPYHYALDAFDNGTIEQSLGAAAVCLAARRMGGNDACNQVGLDQLHWMLGLNPFGYSFLIGAGTTYPKHPQHAWAQKTGMEITGAIVGGPTGMAVLKDVQSGDPSLQLPTATSPLAEWSTDDLVYEDDVTNYVVNEPAIDFTAPLVFVLAELADPRP